MIRSAVFQKKAIILILSVKYIINYLLGHNSHITKVLFDAEAGFLFSGDHLGCIKVNRDRDREGG